MKGRIPMRSPIYSQSDLEQIRRQKNQRWLLLGVPGALLLAVVIVSFAFRMEWLTSAATIVLGALLIAGYDFLVKPLVCYQRHLENCLHGRTRESELSFISLSETVDLVEGVRYRQLLCEDVDGKGRPYERLFYFDAEKTFPRATPGQMLHIVHHDLSVADVYPA